MRDEFSEITKSRVASRVGHLCSNPGCRKPTSGPHDQPDKAVNIGVAAHITAASKGGPRFDPNISATERKSINNAIWLCQSCAKLIDSDEERYRTYVLYSWKKDAEELARSKIEKPSTFSDFDSLPGYFLFLESLILFVDELYLSKPTLKLTDYLEWVKHNDYGTNKEIVGIIDVLEKNPSVGESTLKKIRDWIKGVYDLPTPFTLTMARNIETIYEKVVLNEQSEIDNHRSKVSARLLEMASRNLSGSGVTANLEEANQSLARGTFSFRWRMGTKSTDMMLVEVIGGVLENRISVILQEDFSIMLRAYEALGQEITVKSTPLKPQEVYVITVIWDEEEISLLVQDQIIGTSKLNRPFDATLILMLSGIDIDGILSADRVKQGYKVDGLVGVNLGKGEYLPGARISDVVIFPTPMKIADIKDIVECSKQEVLNKKIEGIANFYR